MKVALFRSDKRFGSFSKKLESYGCEVIEMSFDSSDWYLHDFSAYDCLIYFPSFLGSSSKADSLLNVKSNLRFLNSQFPDLAMFPDPNLFKYYNDKYEQFLYLSKLGFPIAKTIPIKNLALLDEVEKRIGYPCVVKNRYGAGGDYVYLVKSRTELANLVRFANLNFSGWKNGILILRHILSRKFLRGFFGSRVSDYPFLSLPLLVQEFIEHDRDLKLVIGDNTVVEGHWRRKAASSMWKMNVDGGGIGEWSNIPEDIQTLGVSLAKSLGAKWLNIDFIFKDGLALISEFSPVWHHYKYKESDRFVYSDSYNLPLSPETASDLEELIVSSYMRKK